jgi:hypothetical protein
MTNSALFLSSLPLGCAWLSPTAVRLESRLIGSPENQHTALIS